MGRVVDIHTHVFPLEVIELIRSGGGPEGVRVEDRAGREPLIVHGNGLAYPVFPAFYDPAVKLEQMDADGFDVSVVSIGSSLFLFELDPEETARVHRQVNDAAAAYAEAGEGRIVAMATVPMNDPPAAAEELRRAHGLGLRGAHIGTSVEETMLDDRALDPLYAAAEELSMPLVLHPYTSMTGEPSPSLDGFHLSNVIGNPLETCVAASRIALGGVFDRYPEL
jgi:aminocarboxymuconate-semialdehyde decarboxylase